MEMVGTHRSPAVGNAVRAVTGFDRFRCGGAAVHATAVSYTHLDVYKRQVRLNDGLNQFNEEGISKLTGALDEEQIHGLKTVLDEMTSRLEDYTRDVYKRQHRHRSWVTTITASFPMCG